MKEILISYIQNIYNPYNIENQTNIERDIFRNKWILKVNEQNRKFSSKNSFIHKVLFYFSICVITGLLLSAIIISIRVFEKNENLNNFKILNIKNDTKFIYEKTKFVTKIDLQNESFSFNISISEKEITHDSMENITQIMGNNCGPCELNEICIHLAGQSIAKCVQIKDSTDPTGCGGICALETESCREVIKGSNVFECSEVKKQSFPFCKLSENKYFNCGEICLSKSKICDGVINCVDRSDEIDCECNEKTHFKCGDKLSCFPITYKCNGVVDCWDGVDEISCNTGCHNEDNSMDLFPCFNGSNCISIQKFCDGNVDCSDESDEPIGCK